MDGPLLFHKFQVATVGEGTAPRDNARYPDLVQDPVLLDGEEVMVSPMNGQIGGEDLEALVGRKAYLEIVREI